MLLGKKNMLLVRPISFVPCWGKRQKGLVGKQPQVCDA